MGFHKAERRKAKLRLALCGVSGSGKTYSALMIAQGIGGKIAMIDTENGSGELYADVCDYDVCQVTAPYTPEKYIAAIHEAEAGGYNVIIVDSLSHAWAGEGGLLDKHDAISKASRSGNSYAAWREITPLHNKLVDTILQSPCHIIASMRTKTAYEIQDENGKKAPKKVGMAPVQRDGMEYEFTVVMDLSVESHIATASKDRTGIFDGQYFKPTVETGSQLLGWLESGSGDWVPPKPAERQHEAATASINKSSRVNHGMAIYASVARAFKLDAPEASQDEIREDSYKFISESIGREICNQDDLKSLTPGEIETVTTGLKLITSKAKTGTDN